MIDRQLFDASEKQQPARLAGRSMLLHTVTPNTSAKPSVVQKYRRAAEQVAKMIDEYVHRSITSDDGYCSQQHQPQQRHPPLFSKKLNTV